MSAYELNDEQVRILLGMTEADPRERNVALDAVKMSLRDQVSLPRPDKIGAVIKTDHSSTAPEFAVFIRWASDIQTDTPWIMREELDRKVYGNAEIGRIVTILSEGVDV